jgi:RTX calcium-binding nonapeptide repeat (4 copies)
MMGRRRLIVGLLATIGLMVVLTAGVAIAQTQINCRGGVCEGTQADNLMRGTQGADLIMAKGGTDGVNGRGGSDLVRGGPGSDDPGSSPSGHNPSYHLEGGPGHDHVHGGAGEDSVTDEYGPANGYPSDTDVLFGGLANDFLNGLDGDNHDYLDCGPGHNVYSADPGDTVRANCQKNIGPQ